MAMGTYDRLVGRTAMAERHKQERRGVVPARARARALDLPIRAS